MSKITLKIRQKSQSLIVKHIFTDNFVKLLQTKVFYIVIKLFSIMLKVL